MIQLIAILAPLMTGYVEKPINVDSAVVAVNYIESMQWKRVDYDWAYAFQCIDWAQKYISVVHAKNIRQIGSAWNWRRTWKWFEWWSRRKPWITTPPPLPGDIIFMDISWHTKWHVWVVVSATDQYVIVSEQNWAGGNGQWLGWDSIKLHKRYYNVVLWRYTK